jgi:hypothetical protein
MNHFHLNPSQNSPCKICKSCVVQGVCCLMILTNLSLILICIGFIIVLQLSDPPVIWQVSPIDTTESLE